MFQLTEKNISKPLKDVGLITILYYKTRNEYVNLYDMEYSFDENIIPLITSYLEKEPRFTQRKLYTCIDSIIHIDHTNMGFGSEYTKGIYNSFYLDIEDYNKNANKIKINNKNTKLIESFSLPESNELIRIYSRSTNIVNDNNKDNRDFLQYVINEHIENIISYEWEWGTLEIIVKDNKFTMKLNIMVIEDNIFIKEKVKEVNNVLDKLNKIKSVVNIDNLPVVG